MNGRSRPGIEIAQVDSGPSGDWVLIPSHLTIQRAETTTAVGHEWAYAERLGRLEVGEMAVRGNVAEQPQGPRLVAAFLVLTGERLHMLGGGVRLPQAKTTQRLIGSRFHCHGLFHRLCEQHHGVGDAPA